MSEGEESTEGDEFGAAEKYSGLREWANGYRDAEGIDQCRRATVLRLLAEVERYAASATEGALRAENERLQESLLQTEVALDYERVLTENCREHHADATPSTEPERAREAVIEAAREYVTIASKPGSQTSAFTRLWDALAALDASTEGATE